MNCFSKNNHDHPHHHGTSQDATSGFGVQATTLATMMQDRDMHTFQDTLGAVDGLAVYLRSDTKKGIQDTDEAISIHARQQVFGANKFRYPPPKSYIYFMYRACHDLTVIILAVAAIISLVIGLALEEKRNEYGYIEGVAIVVVLFFVILVQASIDYSKEKKFRVLNSVKDNYKVHVIRNGDMEEVLVEDLVVGDLLKLTAGDKIPADCVLVELVSTTMKTNESAMTGEVIDIDKTSERDPFLISGTTISEGACTSMVVAVGESSQWGKILVELVQDPADTPLQERLDRLALLLGKLGIFMASLTFLAALFRWIGVSAQSGNWDGTEVLTALINSIAIVVVALPEGLPLAITLSLAFAMKKLIKDNNLVRVLSACETMGSATQLNADKTGTLTQNRMTVVEAYIGAHWFVYPGADEEAKACVNNELGDSHLPEGFKTLLALGIAVNSQANLHRTQDGLRVEHLGSKTECALLQLVEDWGMNYRNIRESNPPKDVYLFNSTRKRMTTIIKATIESNSNALYDMHCKGAPDILLDLCSWKRDWDGNFSALEAQDRVAITEIVNKMASEGLRTLMLCYRSNIQAALNEDHGHVVRSNSELAELEKDMVLLGVVGIKDPIRPETKDAVSLLRKAGVTVRMVTGDNALTARFIAKEAGILDGTEGPNALLEGPVFRKMTDDEKAAVARDIRVLARSSPSDKLLLVREHKKLGEVVAVTGDGTNDAPALKEADVGFALGLAGTEVAKEACDIVILDDNISSIAKAVLWGRNVYISIRKFLQFQLVVNFVAVSIDFVAACAGVPLPLGAVLLLWVNVAMDSCAALALATEPPRLSLMDKKPFGRHAPLINRAMIRNIVGAWLLQFATAMVLQFAGKSIFNIPCFDAKFGNPSEDPACFGSTLQLNSMIFNTFVFMQVFNEINCRRIEEKDVLRDIWKSGLFIIILVLTIAGQLGIMLGIADTRVGETIGVTSITGPMWAVSVLLGMVQLGWGYLVRFFPLDWCIGPMDEDPTELSKLETIIHWRRKQVKVKAAALSES